MQPNDRPSSGKPDLSPANAKIVFSVCMHTLLENRDPETLLLTV